MIKTPAPEVTREADLTGRKEPNMITIKATFDDGNSIVTRINSTLEDAKAYYIGRMFNLGSVNDDIRRCVLVEEVPA